MSLTSRQLRQILIYHPRTGRWTRKVIRGRHQRWKAGSEAGSRAKNGRWQLNIGKKSYRANRLAWLYMKGRWPREEIDHRDLDVSNDRWRNLREATKSQNGANTKVRRHSKSGIKGVRLVRGKFLVKVNRCRVGTFRTLRGAKLAYKTEARRVHGEFART